MSKKTFEGVGHKTDYAVKENADISRDTIREWMVKDIRGSFITLSEVLNSKECIEALVDVFYKRYLEMHKSKQVQPELELQEKQEEEWRKEEERHQKEVDGNIDPRKNYHGI